MGHLISKCKWLLAISRVVATIATTAIAVVAIVVSSVFTIIIAVLGAQESKKLTK